MAWIESQPSRPFHLSPPVHRSRQRRVSIGTNLAETAGHGRGDYFAFQFRDMTGTEDSIASTDTAASKDRPRESVARHGAACSNSRLKPTPNRIAAPIRLSGATPVLTHCMPPARNTTGRPCTAPTCAKACSQCRLSRVEGIESVAHRAALSRCGRGRRFVILWRKRWLCCRAINPLRRRTTAQDLAERHDVRGIGLVRFLFHRFLPRGLNHGVYAIRTC